jgi:glycosyltransferase involved in cell wall biosynthesis
MKYSMDNISVIIRNRNEAEHIGLAIQSVIDHLGHDTEIIIIDDNSTDDSLEVVALFDQLNISISNIEGHYSPGKALNLGARLATNNTLLVLSAHSQITTLNKEMLSRWFRKGHVAVFGKQTPIYRGKKITPRYIWSHFTGDITENLYSSIENRQFLHNAFCFYDKEFLLENPFDEELSGKEDRYWAIDIVKKGHTYLYDGFYQKCNHYWTNNGATWKGLG